MFSGSALWETPPVSSSSMDMYEVSVGHVPSLGDIQCCHPTSLPGEGGVQKDCFKP